MDLAIIAQDAIAELREEADQAGLSIMTNLAATKTEGDVVLLRQLAANLIHNSIRHNRVGGLVEVTTQHHVARSAVVLRIENTGADYSAEMASRLVEPFLRGSGRISTLDRGSKGYGLGLTLVSRITEIHDGALTIIPRKGGGLVITVTLPNHG